MIDLIIPYYNNPKGLLKTLDSIDTNIFQVTVVDDGSVMRAPKSPRIHRLLRYKENKGPGYARQYGLNHTQKSYIMFIDTGDIFTSIEVQQEILKTITENPQYNFFNFSYYHYGELTGESDNRLHGKVYKRSFLEEYNITFAPLYLDEDIGFNRACRLCTKMKFISLPVIEQIKNEESLTQKDNQASLYKDQTRALSLTTIHTVDICHKNKIQDILIKKEINDVALALYFWFIRTAAERPKFLPNAWTGAKIFYDKYSQEINTNELIIGNPRMVSCLKYRNQLKFPINLSRFIRDINTYKYLPQWYRG